MSATPDGGRKAMARNKERWGEDFPARIGRMGGKAGNTGGFTDRELAARAGKIGGSMSRRSGTKLTPEAKQKVRDGLKHGYKPTLSRADYIEEVNQDNRDKLSNIAKKWSTK